MHCHDFTQLGVYTGCVAVTSLMIELCVYAGYIALTSAVLCVYTGYIVVT